MRLIDADALIEELHHGIFDDCDCKKDYEYLGIDDYIRNQPIAYDADKVINQLEELTKQAEKDTSYHFDNSSNYPCKYNLADLQERRYEVLCEVMKIVKAEKKE